MLFDMRNVKRELENQAESDRTAIFGHSDRESLPRRVSGATATTQQSGPYPVSSAEYIVNQVKLHKRGAFVLLGVLALAVLVPLFLVSQELASCSPDRQRHNPAH